MLEVAARRGREALRGRSDYLARLDRLGGERSLIYKMMVLTGLRKGELASLTHTGGVGPAWTLSKHVLGVYPVGQGFGKCRIEPHTGHLTWARGVFPSVHGDIEVAWKQEGERFILDVDLPDGLETSLTLVCDRSQSLQLIHNGKPFKIPAGAASIPGVEVSGKQIVITVTGGRHHLERS